MEVEALTPLGQHVQVRQTLSKVLWLIGSATRMAVSGFRCCRRCIACVAESEPSTEAKNGRGGREVRKEGGRPTRKAGWAVLWGT